MLLGDAVIDYGPASYLVASLDLPITGAVTQASADAPYLCFCLYLDPALLSEIAFTLRDRGDTTADGRLRLSDAPMPMGTEQAISELSFPYAFPSAGRYRVWVQLRVRGRVRTAAWDVDVR